MLFWRLWQILAHLANFGPKSKVNFQQLLANPLLEKWHKLEKLSSSFLKFNANFQSPNFEIWRFLTIKPTFKYILSWKLQRMRNLSKYLCLLSKKLSLIENYLYLAKLLSKVTLKMRKCQLSHIYANSFCWHYLSHFWPMTNRIKIS